MRLRKQLRLQRPTYIWNHRRQPKENAFKTLNVLNCFWILQCNLAKIKSINQLELPIDNSKRYSTQRNYIFNTMLNLLLWKNPLPLGAKRLPGAEPSAGPPKLKFAQFSCINPKFLLAFTISQNIEKTSTERTLLEKERHHARPWA